jgi:hypothetical protein
MWVKNRQSYNSINTNLTISRETNFLIKIIIQRFLIVISLRQRPRKGDGAKKTIEIGVDWELKMYGIKREKMRIKLMETSTDTDPDNDW